MEKVNQVSPSRLGVPLIHLLRGFRYGRRGSRHGQLPLIDLLCDVECGRASLTDLFSGLEHWWVPLIDLLRKDGVLAEDHWSRASA